MVDVSILDYRELIDGLERDLGVSADTIGRALDVDQRTVEQWRANQRAPRGKTRERLGALIALRDRLLHMFGSAETTRAWLGAPSRYLDGSTPLEVLTTGRLDRIAADLDGLAGGVYL